MRLKNIFSRAAGEESGQTLIEMLIAMFIFSMFIAISVGGFAQMLSAQRVVLKMTSASDNMSLSIEQMLREMRMGANYYSADGNSISFVRSVIDPNSTSSQVIAQTVTYAWDQLHGTITRTIQNGSNPNQLEQTFTASNVAVSYFHATTQYPSGYGTSTTPCLATIVIGITTSDKNQTMTNYIETSVESRAWGM